MLETEFLRLESGEGVRFSYLVVQVTDVRYQFRCLTDRRALLQQTHRGGKVDSDAGVSA